MKFMKYLALALSSFGLVLVFQNCGQPGSVSTAGTNQALKVVEDTEISDVVDHDRPDEEDRPYAELCDGNGMSVKEVKFPSASRASSFFATLVEQNVELKLGANKILIRATDDAQKVDRVDLLLSERNNGNKIRVILDRDDYALVEGKTYELSFNLADANNSIGAQSQGSKNGGHHDDPSRGEDDSHHESHQPESGSECHDDEHKAPHDCKVIMSMATLKEVQ